MFLIHCELPVSNMASHGNVISSVISIMSPGTNSKELILILEFEFNVEINWPLF